ncbi:hypothetical protein [Streptosporangium sp. CA-115845]|uniref:hypothetical protein n=1 Tax=Streptosporangium sp. CA-115845 TaxID=3240071 RepID=UPI003D8CD71C
MRCRRPQLGGRGEAARSALIAPRLTHRLVARMLRVAEPTAERRDLTTAADAGFAGPSHFSEAFHHMFGLRGPAACSPLESPPSTRSVSDGR